MSVLTLGVSVLSGSCYYSQKTLLLEQNTKEIKGDISIVKLDFSDLHKAVITRLKSTEISKNRSFMVLLNQNPSLHNLFDGKN